MPQPFYLPRILGFLTAIFCTCATLSFAAQVTPAKGDGAREASGVIILDAADSGQGRSEMPPVAFDHDRHTRGDKNGETCVTCHKLSPRKSARAATAQEFGPAAGKSGAEREDAFHTGCVSCHSAADAKGMKTGPLQAECRACHDASLPSSGKKAAGTDGGFDTSLHARHIASPMIASSDGEANCAACHHPVKNPVSPGLEADSCRSCHPDSASAKERGPDKPHKSLFVDVAHKKCVSCHQNLPSPEKPALTCASCHDANTKAGYAKVSPLPRLEAGQPDAVMMEPPQPPGSAAVPDMATGGQPSMPPVVFDHKRHEAAAENCTGCHHNTLQKCSTCHTRGNPDGAPPGESSGGASNAPKSGPEGGAEKSGVSKGGSAVSWPEAMHMPGSSRSCVGCHETRKTAEPNCAGCHGAMPAKAQPNCAACHQPPADPGGSPGSSGANNVPDALAAYAAGQKALDTRARASVPDLSNIPEKLVLGSLSDQFEPAVFPHRAIVKKLAAGISDTAPGMLWFHASPDALCASCHHNSPKNTTPGTTPGTTAAPLACASCHAQNAVTNSAAPPDAPPSLKIAYHQQCMTCHTRMDVKPAATDCAGCHALRQKPRKTGGGK